MCIMKIRYLFLTLFSVFCFSAGAQTDKTQIDIINSLTVDGTYTEYSEVYDNMFDVLKAQFRPANVPAQEWTLLMANKDESITEGLTLLAAGYQNQLNEADISKITQIWKRDLFLEKMNALIAKGYQPQN